MPARKKTATTPRQKKKKGVTKKTVTVTVSKKITLPDPERFLSPEHWDIMNTTQLGIQCRMLQIPSGGKQEEKRTRLKRWYNNPRTFKPKKKPPTKKTTATRKKKTTAATTRKNPPVTFLGFPDVQ